MMYIKCNLSTFMGKHKMSIQDVADKTGLNRNTISSFYNEKAKRIDYETITKLCELFNCSIGELFEFEKKKEEVKVNA